MARAKFSELLNLSAAELDQKRNALEKDLYELRQKKASGALDKPHQFRQIRKQIAQVNTAKKELQNAKSAK